MRSAGTRGARTSASWRTQYGGVQRGEKAALILLLFLFWLVLNGKVTLDIVLTGAAVSAALSWFAHRVLESHPGQRCAYCAASPGFCLTCATWWGRSSGANLAVIRLILCPGTGRAKLVWFAPPVRGGLPGCAGQLHHPDAGHGDGVAGGGCAVRLCPASRAGGGTGPSAVL